MEYKNKLYIVNCFICNNETNRDTVPTKKWKCKCGSSSFRYRLHPQAFEEIA